MLCPQQLAAFANGSSAPMEVLLRKYVQQRLFFKKLL